MSFSASTRLVFKQFKDCYSISTKVFQNIFRLAETLKRPKSIPQSFSKYLHYLQQSLCHRLQRGQSEGLSLVRSWREGAIPVAGAERYDGRRLDFADAEQQVKLGQ